MSGEIGKRVKVARESLTERMSQADLSRRLNLDRAIVSNWERGQHNPKDSALNEIASILKVEARWLKTGHGMMRPQEEATSVAETKVACEFSTTIAVPLRRGVLASDGFDGDCSFESDGMMEIPFFFVSVGKVEEYEVVQVTGSSMSPRAASGERVVIRKASEPIPNVITLLRSPDGKVYLKVLRLEPIPMAEPLNPIGETFRNLDGWEILGHAIGIDKDYLPGSTNIEYNQGKPLRA